MPCDYRIFSDDNLVVKKYCGRITYRCVLELLDRMEEDPRFHEGMMEFDDLRCISDLAITASELEKFVDLIRSINTRKRRPTRKAILAPSGAARIAAEGFCKEFEGVSKLEIRVFADPETAFAFLGVSPHHQEHILEWGGLTVH